MHIPHTRTVRLPAAQQAALRTAQRRLAEGIVAGIDESGLLPALCRGRILETALALRLLDLEHWTGAERDDLAAFLRTARDQAGPVDGTLAQAALAGTRLPDGLVESALTGFDHFTAGRKRTMLQAIAVVFGAARPADVVRQDRTGLHRWAATQLTACEVIVAGTATADELDILVAAQACDDIWEGHLLCHLLTLHALRLAPDCAGLVAKGMAKALDRRAADGGIPFIESLDLFGTAVAGLGLVAADADLAVVRTIAGQLAELQGPDGGWGYATGVDQPDADSTSVVIELLREADPDRYENRIRRGTRYLRELRGADGGFPTYLRGAKSEVAMSAAVANAADAEDVVGRDLIFSAAEFMADVQYRDGTFEPGWSRSTPNALCRVLLALRTAIESGIGDRTAMDRAITRSSAYLVCAQRADGGWGHRPDEASDPISTAFAVIGLARCDGSAVRRTLADGLTYLLAEQLPGGGYVSRPDSTGPRGFVYDVPVLADVYVLLAMGHLLGRRSETCNSKDR
jgi:hypothetical protein